MRSTRRMPPETIRGIANIRGCVRLAVGLSERVCPIRPFKCTSIFLLIPSQAALTLRRIWRHLRTIWLRDLRVHNHTVNDEALPFNPCERDAVLLR